MTNRKPNQRTEPEFSKPLQTTCLGWGKGPQSSTSDLGNTEDKVSIKAVLLFRSQGDGAVRFEWAMIT